MRSISLYGLSDVIMTFEDGTDPYFARAAGLPADRRHHAADRRDPGIAPLSSPSGLVYRYVLQSPDRSADGAQDDRRLGHLQGVQVRSRRRRPVAARRTDHAVPGRSSIRPSSPGAGLSVPDVVDALGANNDNAGGGFYSEGGQFYYVRGLGRLATPEDIGNIVARRQATARRCWSRTSAGRDRLRAAPRAVRLSTAPTTPSRASILMRTGEQAQTVLKRVEAKTDELNNRILPQGCPHRAVLRSQRPDRISPRARSKTICCAASCS